MFEQRGFAVFDVKSDKAGIKQGNCLFFLPLLQFPFLAFYSCFCGNDGGVGTTEVRDWKWGRPEESADL